jgi:hypothetical protein
LAPERATQAARAKSATPTSRQHLRRARCVTKGARRVRRGARGNLLGVDPGKAPRAHSPEPTFPRRQFLISPRARDAIADYLKVARRDGWLASSKRLEGPLWISTHHHGTQQRMSQRTATQAWHTLQQGLSGLSQEYQLDDVMLTARVEFMRRVKGSRAAEILAEHAGISSKWAGHYSDHLSSPESSARDVARDVISQLGQKAKRKSG